MVNPGILDSSVSVAALTFTFTTAAGAEPLTVVPAPAFVVALDLAVVADAALLGGPLTVVTGALADAAGTLAAVTGAATVVGTAVVVGATVDPAVGFGAVELETGLHAATTSAPAETNPSMGRRTRNLRFIGSMAMILLSLTSSLSSASNVRNMHAPGNRSAKLGSTDASVGG